MNSLEPIVWLLAVIFPAGIPPRQDVIRAVNNWLDEAERLARLR